jgi:hypothetical protein
MKTVTNKTHRVIDFEDFDEYLEQCGKDSRKGNNRDSYDSETTPKESWDLKAGFAGAQELSRNGWEKGAMKMAKVRSLVSLPENSDRSIQPQPIWAEDGDEVDVDRYLAGEENCMIQFMPELTPSYGRVAKIIVNLAASCGIDSETQFRRGAAACVLIDALEAAGVRCEVWSLPFWGMSGGDLFGARVLIKRPDEHVEPDRMAFMLAHSAVMRRFGFRLLEQQEGRWGEMSHAFYGSPADIPLAEQNEEGTIYFGRQYGPYGSDDGMIVEVNRLLAKYLELEEEGAVA